jgi:hypothetical protein
VFAAALGDGRTMVVHQRGGEKVGISIPDNKRLFCGSDSIVVLRDRQDVVVRIFSMGEPPDEFTPVAPEEVQRLSSGSGDFELFEGEVPCDNISKTRQFTNVPPRSV